MKPPTSNLQPPTSNLQPPTSNLGELLISWHPQLSTLKCLALCVSMLTIFQTALAQSECMDTDDPASDNDFLCYDINRYECAWEITHGSEDIVVAIVDNFSRLDHPDMVGKYAYIDDEYDPSNIVEGHHGLIIAGIVAAVPNNGTCHAGVGYDTRVAIYDLGLRNSCNGIGGGVRKAIGHGYKIISTSCSIIALSLSEMEDFIDDGGVFISSAVSSDHISHRRAREIDGFINVGSMIWNHTEGRWENQSTNCDCATPNVDIFVSNLTGRLYNDRTCGTGPGGTSMCSPQVAGVAALMRSVNPCISGAAIERIMRETGVGNILHADNNCHPQRLDAEAAVLAAMDYVPEDLIFDAPTVIQDLYPEGNIILEAGADVHVTGTIKMHHEKRIVVRRGARLHIDGGEVRNSFCTEDWKGIYVEGNSVNPTAPEDAGLTFVPQPSDPFGPLVTEQPGILILNNGATIRNARFGADMKAWPDDYSWPTSNNYYGGLLHADGADFIGCKVRGVLFAHYTDEHSVIKNCRFEENQMGVAMWRNGGPEITTNEFIRQVSNDILTINSSPQIHDGNHFEGDPSSLFIDARISALNTHPNSPGVPEIGRLSTSQNEFSNWNSDAIRLDGGVLAEDVSIINNEFRDGFFGVSVQGESWFEIRDNRFYDLLTGLWAFETGDDHNQVWKNRFENNDRGIDATNKNDGLLFPWNCFESNTRAIYLSSYATNTIPFLPPSVRPLQRGPGTFTSFPFTPSDCCFLSNGTDVSVFYFDGLFFRYVVNEDLNLQDCRLPDQNSGVFTYWQTSKESEGIMCDILPSIDDPGEPTALDELLAARTELQLQLQQLEASDQHPDLILDLTQTIHQYLEIIEIRIINHYMDDGQDAQAEVMRSESPYEDVRLAYYGALVNHGRWHEARQELAALSTEAAGWEDFRSAQELWLNKLEVGDRSASEEERQWLYAMGMQNHKYAGWIRGIYAALTHETIRLPQLEAELNGTERMGDKASDEIRMRIYPNPAKDVIQLDVEGWSMDAPYSLSLYAMDGRQVAAHVAPANHIDVKGLDAGVYLAVIRQDGLLLHQERIVIIK